MAKAKVRYECSSCGSVHNSFSGKCSICGEWNTIQQQLDVASADISKGGRKLDSKVISEVVKKSSDVKRIPSNDQQLDNVLGGGFVPGRGEACCSPTKHQMHLSKGSRSCYTNIA